MSENEEEDDISAILRFLSVIAMVVGVGAIYAYPWAVKNLSGREIGIYRIYDDGKFPAAAAILADTDAPVRVMVDVVAVEPMAQRSAPLVISVVASTRGEVVFSETLKLRDVAISERNPETIDPMHRNIAGLIRTVEPGIYSFEIGQPGISGVGVRSVDVVLRGGVMEVDQRAHLPGFFLVAAGLAGVAVSMARGHDRTTRTKPPAKRWGRNADQT